MENQIKWNKASEVLPEKTRDEYSDDVEVNISDGNNRIAFYSYETNKWYYTKSGIEIPHIVIEWAAITPQKD